MLTLPERICRAVIFDLDGTLINSAPDIAVAVNRVLAGMGRERLPVRSIERFIGDGPRSMLMRIFAELSITADDAFLDRALQSYLTCYEAAPTVKTRLFPGVMQDLQMLSDSGLRLGICTNKTHHLAQLILHKLELSRLFEAILGVDAVPRHKPHADHLLAVTAAMRLKTSEIIYVGDTVVDQQCAFNAGVPFYTVNWGGGGTVTNKSVQRISRLADIKRIIE